MAIGPVFSLHIKKKERREHFIEMNLSRAPVKLPKIYSGFLGACQGDHDKQDEDEAELRLLPLPLRSILVRVFVGCLWKPSFFLRRDVQTL